MKNFAVFTLLAVGIIALGQCSPFNSNLSSVPQEANPMWISQIEHGIAPFNDRPNDYQVYRNVMDFGCAGDGIADDTACINTAISSGGRCGNNCGSATNVPALIYFPSGRYKISSPVIMYYFSQLVGNARDPPTIIASPDFRGIAMFDSDPYGDGGNNWYTNQNNFFRQVRNFIFDTTQTPSGSTTTGVHWQVAQATSLVNLRFIMTVGSNHQGVWMENGSGGFMSDLHFEGGKYGLWLGNQQFLSLRLTFDRCDTAIFILWNWQWSFKSITINNARIGVDISQGSDGVRSGIGSVLLYDSVITDTQTAVLINGNYLPTTSDTSDTLLLDNVRLVNTPVAVKAASGETVLNGGTTTVTSWGRGSRYMDNSGRAQYISENLPAPIKDASLLDGQGKFFERSRPQYENLGVNDFASVKAGGARGDGVTDDTDAIQNVINANRNGKVVYFPSGNYIISRTVKVPGGTRIIGELWSVLMASGSVFQNPANPVPMIQVGDAGEVGTVEISDIMFSTKGAQPGAVLLQWNIRGPTAGSAGMWDSHFRVGGYRGSNLQVPQCPKGQNYVPQCHAAHTLFHITTTGSGLFENVWAWTADHDLDNNLAQGQVSIYVDRGVHIESQTGPVWMYGIQSEHNVLYQYQFTAAKNVFVTMIQSETPYWQPGPAAPTPATVTASLNDPSYAHCNGRLQCAMAYALRVVRSSNIYVYGAGMYNFFFNYDQTCLDTESCQDNMVELESNSRVYLYNANTKAATNMIVRDNTQVLATQADNKNGFCQTINAFLADAN